MQRGEYIVIKLKKEKIFKLLQSPFFITFIINCIFVFFLYMFNIPLNETNDDTGMAAIVSNAYGNGSNHMIFSNVIFAFMLKILYFIFPNLNCYSTMQFIITFISFIIIGYIIIKNAGKKLGVLLYILLLSFFAKDFYLIYQFTRVSMFCCISGSILLIFALHEHRKKLTIFAFLWTLLGTLIRYKSFISIGPIIFSYALIFILHDAYKKNKTFKLLWNNIRKYFLVVIVFFSSMLGCIILDNQFYNSNEEWKEYKTYNRVRADLLDYGWPESLPDYNLYKEEYQKLNISENDLEFYSLGNLSDEKNLPIDKLEKLLILKEKYTYSNYNLKELFKSFIEYTRTQTLMQIFIITSIIYVLVQTKLSNGVFALLNFLSVLLMYGYLFSLNRVVDRVMIPIIFSAMIALLCSCKKEDLRYFKLNNSESALLFITTCFIAVTFTSQSYQNRVNEYQTWNVDNLYKKIEQNNDDIYIAARMTFGRNYNFFSSFKSFPENFYSRHISIGGWLDRTPITKKIQQNLSLENIYNDLIERKDVYYYTYYEEFMLETYLKEHYNSNISLSIADYTIGNPNIKFIQYNDNNEVVNNPQLYNEILIKDINFDYSKMFTEYYQIKLKLDTQQNLNLKNCFLQMEVNNRLFLLSICETKTDDYINVFIPSTYVNFSDLSKANFSFYKGA